MNTKFYIAGRFYAWKEAGETPIAFSFDGEFFVIAINCLRDQHVVEDGKDENGVYNTVWIGDSIHNAEVSNVRYATPKEVKTYMDFVHDWAREAAGSGWQDRSNRIIIDPIPVSITQTPEYTEVLFSAFHEE